MIPHITEKSEGTLRQRAHETVVAAENAANPPRLSATNTGRLIEIDKAMIERIRRNHRGFATAYGDGYDLYMKALGRAHTEAERKCLGKWASSEEAASARYFMALNDQIHLELSYAFGKVSELLDRVQATTIPAKVGGVDDVIGLFFPSVEAEGIAR